MESEKIRKVSVSAKALIESDGKYLCVHDHNAAGQLIFDLPGGRIEFAEDPRETVLREVQEELGIEVEIERFLGYWTFINQEKGYQLVALTFLCKLVTKNKTDIQFDFSQNPAIDERIDSAEWLNKEELTDRDHLNNSSLRKLLVETLP